MSWVDGEWRPGTLIQLLGCYGPGWHGSKLCSSTQKKVPHQNTKLTCPKHQPELKHKFCCEMLTSSPGCILLVLSCYGFLLPVTHTSRWFLQHFKTHLFALLKPPRNFGLCKDLWGSLCSATPWPSFKDLGAHFQVPGKGASPLL